jgi:hypothetical protein
MQLQAAGLWPSPPPPNFIEDVFSTYLYTGTGASLTITNGINLSGKGGLVWQKDRPSAGTGHYLQDTVRGVQKYLLSNTTDAEVTNVNTITAFNSNGYTVGGNGNINGSGEGIVSWTFREQPKFFDIVTYTGDGVSGRTVAHNLGSEPGFILVKLISGAGSGWQVWHRYDGVTAKVGLLETTDDLRDAAYSSSPNLTFLRFAPTASDFTLKAAIQSDANACNASGETYVAYLFAHNAGGFGLTGTDNVITCGSYTTVPGSPVNVNLGYEPQWLLVRRVTPGGAWFMFDIMRGFTYTDTTALLANSSGAEFSYGTSYFKPTATGFTAENGFFGGTSNIIYIAIRRGPMRVPTLSTSVFYPTTYTGTGVARTFSGFGFPPDFELSYSRGGSAAGDNNGPEIYDKLRGTTVRLLTPSTSNETSGTEPVTMIQDGISVGATVNSYINASGFSKVLYALRRAPSFFDEVCYTGNSIARTVNHNLAAVPELMIIKMRNNFDDWYVYSNALTLTEFLVLNTNQTKTSSALWNTAPTSSVFGLSSAGNVNANGFTYVAYLFATCPGVSKVGSYTGTGATQTIDCGFTGGARWVLIKRTNNTGDWYIWDTARGMVSGTDPSFFLNSTTAEVNANSVFTTATGFQIVSTATGINASGGTYIFLAIA